MKTTILRDKTIDGFRVLIEQLDWDDDDPSIKVSITKYGCIFYKNIFLTKNNEVNEDLKNIPLYVRKILKEREDIEPARHLSRCFGCFIKDEDNENGRCWSPSIYNWKCSDELQAFVQHHFWDGRRTFILKDNCLEGYFGWIYTKKELKKARKEDRMFFKHSYVFYAQELVRITGDISIG